MNKKNLELAREWASDNLAKGHFKHGERVLAAAKVIVGLPDEWVDAKKLREVLESVESDSEKDLYDEIVALLPVPFSPRWGKRAWHDFYGEVLVTSEEVDGEVEVSRKTDSFYLGRRYIKLRVEDLSEVVEGASQTIQIELPEVGEAWIVDYYGKTCFALHDGGEGDDTPWRVVLRTGESLSVDEGRVTRIEQLLPRGTR